MKSFNTCLKIAKNNGFKLDKDIVDIINKGISVSKSGIALDRDSQLKSEQNIVEEMIDSVNADRDSIIKKAKQADTKKIKVGKTVSWENKKGEKKYGTVSSFNTRTGSWNIKESIEGKNIIVKETNLKLSELPEPKRKEVKADEGFVGKNEDGQNIYTNKDGARQIEEDGVLITQSVSMVPNRATGLRGEFDGIEALFSKGKTRFLTKDEVKQRKFEKSVQKGYEVSDALEDSALRADILLFFYRELINGESFKNIVDARNQVVDELNLEPIKSGTIESKIIDEIIERAGVRAAKNIIKVARKAKVGNKEIFDRLVKLQSQMPNLAVRTSTSVRDQAYSTPLPLAFLASEYADINNDTTVYEPSSGNGALLIGSNPENVTANELNKSRYEGLRRSAIQTVKNEDGTTLKVSPKKDVIIANPPFGAVKDDAGTSKTWEVNEDFTTTQIDHAMVFKSLESMKDDGKAVFIVGSVMDRDTSEDNRKKLYRAKNKVRFYKTLYDNYNVVEHVSVAGKLYSKQGAAFPVDIIVIHGKGKSNKALPGVTPPGYLSTIEEVREKFDEINSLDNQRGRDTSRDSGSSLGTKGLQDGSQGTQYGDDTQGTKSDRPGSRTGKGSEQTVSGLGGLGNQIGTHTQDGADSGGGSDVGQPDIGGLPADNELQTAGETDKDGKQTGKDDTGRGREPGSRDVPKQPGSIEEELAAMSEDDIDNLLDDAFEPKNSFEKVKAKKQKAKPIVTPEQRYKANQKMINYYFRSKQKPSKKPKKGAALNSLSGVNNAVKGLGALFSPKNTFTSGLIFNEDTWKAAKPYFVEAWEDAKAAGHSLKKLVQHLATKFDAAIKPYLKRFFVEQSKIEKEILDLTEPKPDLKTNKVKESDTQVPYHPESGARAIGTLTPVNMALASKKALSKITNKYGSIDKYVAKELGYKLNEVLKYFSGEQADAIALSIANLSKGAGFIIGDQTGVGKGRVVAAMIRYAMKNELTPIFVTDNAGLYSDMYRDLSDIGMADIFEKILITNTAKKVPLTPDGEHTITTKSNHVSKLNTMTDNKSLDGAYDVIFTTYSQMNLTGSPRRAFLEAMVDGGNAMIILDESHKAGGSGMKETAKRLPSSIWFRKLIDDSHSTFYSSATYAKRPDVMDLYLKTDMRLAVDDIAIISDAIKAGGIPLQQAVATMLVEAGQYVRRERSFEGVKYLTDTVKVDHRKAEDMSLEFKEIFDFSNTYIDQAMQNIADVAATEGVGTLSTSAAGAGSINTVGFAGVMHNIIGQSLLILKTKQVVEKAIKAHQGNKAIPEGQKPILTLSNTMESFITQYTEDHGLSIGDGIGLKFNDLLFEYLDKTRRYTIKEPFKEGPGTRHYISDAELGEEGLREYNRIKENIYNIDFGDLPISPIDYALNEFKKAGINAAEITGRQDIIEYREDGTQRYSRRPNKDKTVASKLAVINDFNTDKIDALIINRSASTGLSLHALPKWEGHDPRQRKMIILQPEANIDEHMQILGRVHRAGQVKPPEYSQDSSDLPTEKRPAAVLAAKMASLNANTTASKEGDLSAKDVTDFMNKYGDRVAANIMADYPEIYKQLGRPLSEIENTESGFNEYDAAKKVTGRIPLLPSVPEQEFLYDLLEAEYNDLITQLNATGQNDLEAKTFDSDAKTLQQVAIFSGTGDKDSPFTDKAYAERIDMKRFGKSYSGKEVQKLLADEVGKDVKTSSSYEISQENEAFHDATRAETLDKFKDYKMEILDEIEKAERRFAQEVRLDAIESDWRSIMNSAVPGSVINIPIGDRYFDAVVLKVAQQGKPKLPLALGTWKVTLAVPDSMRRIVLPFSMISRLEGFYNRGYVDEQSLKKFDNATDNAREDRTVMTGNMLAAYAQYPRGRIINFYDNKNEVRQGILMPQDFNLEEAEANRKVVLSTVKDVKTVLDAGIFVKSRRGDLTFTRQPTGRQTISVPSSKSGGSKYFLKEGLIDAIGVEFVKSGSRMRVTIPSENLERTLDYLINDMNEVFENGTRSNKVRTLLGIESPSFEDGTEFSTTTDYVQTDHKKFLNELNKETNIDVIVDNPGGEWLQAQQARAKRHDRIENTSLIGAVTTNVREMNFPVDSLTRLPGLSGEHNRIKPGDKRVAELAEKMKKDGYKGSPVFINVHYDGKAVINEGNHRVRAAELAGLENIPIEISYFAGGEAAHGDMSPRVLLNSTKSFSTDRFAGEGVTLSDIQKQFKGQDVFLSNDGSISVRFKNGQGIKIINTTKMSKEDIQLAIETGRMSKNGVILGKTQGATITLNKDLAGIKTLIHETKHALDNLGIITPTDNMAIKREFNKLKKEGKLNFKESNKEKENMANTMAQVIQDRAKYRNTLLGRLIQKITDFFDKLRNIGQQSITKFAKEYESGKIFERKADPGKVKEAFKSKLNQGPMPVTDPGIAFQTSDDFENTENEIYRDALDFIIASEERRKKQKSKITKGVSEGIEGDVEDISAAAMALKTTMYNAFKIGGAAKRTFNVFRKQTDWKFEKINELLFDDNERDLQKVLNKYRSADKAGYKELNDYVVNNDRNAKGHVVVETKEGLFKLYHWKKENGKRKHLGNYFTEDEAWSESRKIEVSESGLNPAGQEALQAVRLITRQLYKHYSKDLKKTMEYYREAGKPMPKVVTMRNGETTSINLKQALKELGSRQGYYFPRLRQSGQFRVTSTKDGKTDIKFFDTRFFAKRYRSKMDKKGYTSGIKHVGKTSEDVFQSLGTVLDRQQAINKVLKKIANKDKERALEDVNIYSDWEGKDLVIGGRGIDKILAKELEVYGGKLEKEEVDDAIRYTVRFSDVHPQMITTLEKNVTDTALYSNKLFRDTDMAFSEAFAKEFDTLIKSRGSMARMIGRSDEVGEAVPKGYEEDLIQALVQTATSAAGGYAKGRVAQEAMKAMTGRDVTFDDYLKDHGQKLKGLEAKYAKEKTAALSARIRTERTRLNEQYQSSVFKRGLQEDKQSRIYKDLKTTLQDILRNDETIDMLIGTLKGLAVLKYLGFRVSSAAINLTALVTGVPAVFSGETDGRISLNKALRSVSKAGTEFLKAGVGKSKYQELFDDIRKKGFDEPKLNKEAFREIQGKLGRGWNTALETSMYMFGMTEKFNRATTIAAAYMALKDTHKVTEHGAWNHDEMLDKAREMSDHSHGIYEKSDRPFYTRGDHIGAKIGQMSYVFHKYIHNYIQEMIRLGYDKKQYKAAAYMMLSPALFGIGSTLPIGIAKALSEALGGDDPEEKLIQMAKDNFGQTAGRVARYGVTGIGDHGISLKGSLATRFGAPQDFYEIFGAPGSAVGDIYSGGKSIWKGQYREGAEKILPTAFGSALKGEREAREGVTSRSGAKIFFGKKQLKGDNIDTMLRVMAFNPTHIAEKKEVQWHEYGVRKKYNAKKSDIYKKFKQYYYQDPEDRNKNELKQLHAEARDFNLEIKDKKMTRFLTPISKKTIRMSLERGRKPSKSERRRKL